MTDGGVRVVGDDQRHDIETNLQVFSIVSACEKLSDLEILPTLFAVDGFAGKPFSVLDRVFTSANTKISSSRAMISASPAWHVQFRAMIS